MITIIKYIREILIQNLEIQKLIGSKIFPIVAPIETKYPFVTLTRDSYKPNYSKGGFASVECGVSVFVLSPNYEESIKVAALIVEALENKRIDEINVRDIQIEDIDEDFDSESNVYIQRIMLNIK